MYVEKCVNHLLLDKHLPSTYGSLYPLLCAQGTEDSSPVTSPSFKDLLWRAGDKQEHMGKCRNWNCYNCDEESHPSKSETEAQGVYFIRLVIREGLSEVA